MLSNDSFDNAYEELEYAISSPQISDARLIRLLSALGTEAYLTSPLIFDLIVEKKFKVLERLYKLGIPFCYQSSSGANALHVACGISGSLKAVKFLIEKNIFTDINAQTDEGETPFMLSIMYEHIDILKYFLQHFVPDLKRVTIYGDTSISLAQKSGNAKIQQLLCLPQE
jgi:ankyrin repeat protein